MSDCVSEKFPALYFKMFFSLVVSNLVARYIRGIFSRRVSQWDFSIYSHEIELKA